MAVGAGCRELGCGMGRVRGLVIVCQVAADAGGWRGGIVGPVMAGAAVEGDVGPGQDVIVVVDGEGGRFPVWRGGVTGDAGGRDADACMVWVGGGIIIGQVASFAGIRGGGIVALVAAGTIGCDGRMRAGKRVIVAMNGEGCRFPARCSGMAGSAVGGNIFSDVVRIGRLVVVRGMTAIANRRSSCIAVCMAFDAFQGGMGAGERETRVGVVEGSVF